MKEKIKGKIIRAEYLDINLKQKTLDILENIIFNKYLCHGDFHVYNLLETKNEIKIIDWVDSSSGNSEADICRTYLLYKIYSEELAGIFIETYCKMANVEKDVIIKWIPIMAAVKLSERINDKELIEKYIKMIKENV